MDLYILRHGIAVDFGTQGYDVDSERPLTPEGRKKLKKIAAAMKELEVEFDVIVSSPYLRARETAEIVAQEFDATRKLRFSDHLVPDAGYRELIAELNKEYAHAKGILLVGHEPHLSGLVSLLVAGSPAEASIDMKKAGLARLVCAKLEHGRCAHLEWLAPPRVMLRIG